MARLLTRESMVESHIVEIQAGLMRALEFEDAPIELRKLLLNLVEKAHYTQGVQRGLKSKDNQFNAYLLELSGIERLS